MLLFLLWAIWVGLLFALRFFRWENVVKLATGGLPRIKEFKVGQLTMTVAMQEREEQQDKQITALDVRLREVENKQQALASTVQDLDSLLSDSAAEEA